MRRTDCTPGGRTLRTRGTTVLRHWNTDCPGDWHMGGDGETCQLYCEACGAHLPATAALREEAIEENVAGELLRRLADEGASLR